MRNAWTPDLTVALRSALVPPYVRKAKSIEAALPWLYLKGISTGEMGSALKMLLGSDATGFSAKTISRLKGQWAVEYNDWRRADLDRDEWVYVWADGIYSGLRGTDDRLCVLVVIGVNARGEKHFLAIEDGVREFPSPFAQKVGQRISDCVSTCEIDDVSVLRLQKVPQTF